MFEKLYKEANDQIPLNAELLEKLKNEARHPRKKQLAAIYKYGFAAAALLIVTVSLNVLPNMQKTARDEMADTAVCKDNTPQKVSETSESDTSPVADIDTGSSESDMASSAAKKKVKDEASTKSTSSSMPAKQEETKTSVPSAYDSTQNNNISKNPTDTVPRVHTTIEKNPYMENIDSKPESDTSARAVEQHSEGTLPSAATETEETIDINSIPEKSEETESAPTEGRKAVSGDGGGSAKQSITEDNASFSLTVQNSNAADNTVFLGIDEYIAYFGFADISVPTGMIITNGDNILMNLNSQTGEFETKDHTAIYADKDRVMEITYKNDITDINSKINSADGEKYKNNCLISTVPSGFKAYVRSGDKGYIITFTNVDKKNVYSVIDSIKNI